MKSSAGIVMIFAGFADAVGGMVSADKKQEPGGRDWEEVLAVRPTRFQLVEEGWRFEKNIELNCCFPLTRNDHRYCFAALL
jgi:hypothetical protein